MRGFLWEDSMPLRGQFAKALRLVRKNTGLTQEDFAIVSSRTYVSSLERGLKSPTLDKIEQLSDALATHPATLVLLAYLVDSTAKSQDALWERLRAEVNSHLKES